MTTAFQANAFQVNAFQIDVSPTVVSVTESPLGGSKARKSRGPYSDPAIYKAYIARCIAERNAPRTNVEVAVLKETLVSEVETRKQTGYAERDALLRENTILERLLSLEKAKRALAAISARQKQIAKQIEELERPEAMLLLAWFNDDLEEETDEAAPLLALFDEM